MSLHVFISHSSEDREVAEQVCDMIEKRGLKCWIAPRNIVPGREYASEIIDAINGCGALVLVLTENANNSKFVAKEVERAVDRGKPVIPLRVREVKPGKSLELFISSSHWIDAFTSPMDAKMDQLESALRPLCEMPPAPARPAAPRVAAKPAPKPTGKPPYKAIGIGVGALVVLGVAGSLLMGGDEEPARPEPSRTPQVATAEAQARPQASTPADTKPAPQPETANAAPASPAEPLPPVEAPLPAAESELVAAVGKASGYQRVNAIKALAAKMPASLSEAAVAALVGSLEGRERSQALDFLANYMQTPLTVDGLEVLARPLQGSWRSGLFKRLGAQDVLPRDTSAEDAARLMRGLDDDARIDAIAALAPVMAPVLGVEQLNAVANPLTGYQRRNAFTLLARQDRLGDSLHGVDIGPALRENDYRERYRMIEVFVPYLAADQNAADLSALLGPMEQGYRANLMGLLRNHDKLASGMALADALELIKGGTDDARVDMIAHLAPLLAEPPGGADMVQLVGPLTGHKRLYGIQAIVRAGRVAPVDDSGLDALGESMDDRNKRRLAEALAPFMAGPG